MVKKNYIPDRGDIVWLNFDPTIGHEQSSKRPALVISPKLYNRRSGMTLVCPVTQQKKDYPFEVEIVGKIKGAILVDHVKSIDWKARKVSFVEKVNFKILKEVQQKLLLLIN